MHLSIAATERSEGTHRPLDDLTGVRFDGPMPSPIDAEPEALLARARSLAPTIEAEAYASEQASRLTPRCVEALRASGLLAASVPRELGGAECSLETLISLVEEISRQDGSTGWCLGMNALVSGICTAALPDSGIERLLERADGDPRRIWIAGGFPPQGRADRDADSWRVTGHFRFGSGLRHADFAACTVLEMAGDSPRLAGDVPCMRTFVVPRETVRLADNWQVAGLEATGSCDYFLEDARIPDDASFASHTLSPHRGGSLYRLLLPTLAGAPHAGFALGVGRRALDEVAKHAGWRKRLASDETLAARGAFQQGFARARTRLEAARALVFAGFAKLDAARDTPAGPSLEERAQAHAATVNAYEAAQHAAEFAFRAAGAAAVYRDNRLQRCLRDIQTGAQHILASEENWDRLGRYWLGLDAALLF